MPIQNRVMVRRVVIESFRRDLPDETKSMSDEEILEMVRRSVWEADGVGVEFVDNKEEDKEVLNN
jgi:hypothetical protein